MVVSISILLILGAIANQGAPITTTSGVRTHCPDSANPTRAVQLKDVVVAYHNAEFKQLFVQDSTGSAHVRLEAKDWPKGIRTGDVVHVWGTVHTGNLFGTVTAQKVEVTGRRANIKPVRFDMTSGRSSFLDGQLVSVRGRVRNRITTENVTTLTIASFAGEIPVVFTGTKVPTAAGVGAEVTVRGLCSTNYIRNRVATQKPRVLVPDESSLDVHASGLPDVFNTAAVPIPRVKELCANVGEGGDLVRVTGVLLAERGRRIFIQDTSGTVTANLVAGETAPKPGSLVDIVGTPARIGTVYGLEECMIRTLEGTASRTEPIDAPLEQLGGGGFHARLVRTEGRVMDVSYGPDRLRISVFEHGHFVEALLGKLDAPASRRIVPGARVSLVGVSDGDRASGVDLILRTVDDITVLSDPPFWTSERAWALFGGFGAVSIVGVVGLLAMRHQVRRAAHQIQKQFDERAALESQFLKTSQLDKVGQLAGGVAHEFNNLLTVINGCATLLTEAVDGGRPAELADDIRRAGERAAVLTSQLQMVSQQKKVVPQLIDLNAIVRDNSQLLGRVIGSGITIRLELDVTLPVVKADPTLVSQVLLNLGINARDAMPSGGSLTLGTATITASDGSTQARLSVSDTGTGMTEEVKARLFEPYFTTKGIGKGTGLGLATVFGIVRSLGGQIRCFSTLEVGTTFEIDLPTSTSVVDSPTPLPPSLAAMPHLSDEFSYVILLVEDDADVRALARKVLELRKLTVLAAEGPDDAIQTADNYPDRIDLLLTDIILPGMTGRELAERIRGKRPGVRVLYMSGHTREEMADYGIFDEMPDFVSKPFTPTHLLNEVIRTLGVATA